MANLSLMALGSSAPEILLSVIETINNLGKPAGELGPSTIVGSAAFNLLVISGVSILCVENNKVKKIDDVGVFAITTISSMFAYFWLLVILVFSTKDQIELWEAILTFAFFFVLLFLSYAADRYRAMRKRKLALTNQKKYDTDHIEKKIFKTEDFVRVLRLQKAKTKEEPVPLGLRFNVFVKEAFNKDHAKDITSADILELNKNKSVLGERLKYKRRVGGHIHGNSRAVRLGDRGVGATLKEYKMKNQICGFR